MSVKEITAKLNKCPTNLVEITGGEPLLQQETSQLAARLISRKRKVLIETNGSLDISPLPKGIIRIMDIKCPSSGYANATLWTNIKALRPTDQLKFVLSDRKDYRWARDVIISRKLAKKCAVLISPVWRKLKLSDLAKWVLQDALPVRIQPQLHKIMGTR